MLKVTATKNKNKLEVLNPIRSLEPKHILFYYRADCLALERRHSGLRQVTKTDKDDNKKIKDVRKQYKNKNSRNVVV